MGIREEFCKKLYNELQDYKRTAGNEENSSEKGKLELFSVIYNILVMSADELSDALLMDLINRSSSILESIYKEVWNDDCDGLYADVKEQIRRDCFGDEEPDAEEYSWWDNPAYNEGGDEL